MKQMMFDYFCTLADDCDHPLTSDDVWEAHQYAFEEFDCSDFYNQLDFLVKQFLAKK